jgi:hypothetical protein
MEGFEQARARWFLGGCFGVFTIPFFIVGVNVLIAGIRMLHSNDARDATILVSIGVAFTAFAAGFAAMIWWILRNAQVTSRRIDLYASQPWLWREDWAARRVAESGPSTAPVLWIFALMWNAIAIPIAVVVGRQRPPNPFPAILFLFPAIGLVLIGAAVYQTLQRRKFGRSICAIDRLPVEPGQTLSGTIEHRGTQVPDAGYWLVLSCINRIVTGSGRNRSTSNEVLWDAEQRISGGVAAPSPMGMRVPFSFDIPADAPSADLRKPFAMVLWQLEATAELPGIDYTATFELPVFATSDKFAAHYATRREAASRRALPPESRITETPLPGGGVELRVAPARDVRSFSVFVMVAVVWFGVIAFMWNLGAPRFIAGIFSLFGLLILAIAIDFFAGRSIVAADRAGVRARHTVLGIATAKSIDAAQIESIEPKVGGHTGNHPYFDVEARLKDRSARTLARYLKSRSDAETVAAKLSAALR